VAQTNKAIYESRVLLPLLFNLSLPLTLHFGTLAAMDMRWRESGRENGHEVERKWEARERWTGRGGGMERG